MPLSMEIEEKKQKVFYSVIVKVICKQGKFQLQFIGNLLLVMSLVAFKVFIYLFINLVFILFSLTMFLCLL